MKTVCVHLLHSHIEGPRGATGDEFGCFCVSDQVLLGKKWITQNVLSLTNSSVLSSVNNLSLFHRPFVLRMKAIMNKSTDNVWLCCRKPHELLRSAQQSTGGNMDLKDSCCRF